MKSYYITFYNGKKPICGTWKRAVTKEEALLYAEFSIICHYPNVKYTNCICTTEKE